MIAIRPAADEEREAIAVPWMSILRPHDRPVDDDTQARMTQVGRFELGTWWLRRALEAEMRQHLDVCELLVADHPDVENWPLGWVAYLLEPRFTLLALHVRKLARRRGVGLALLRHVLALHDERPSCAVMNGPGRALLAKASEGRVAA